jgi:anthranilate synthase/aminodeoxychorismate synthase-like glutamine amidotransferase
VHPVVKRDTDITLSEIEFMDPDRIVISPGPMRPEDHPLIFEIIEKFHTTIPIFGVCLGMQAINEFFGGRLREAELPVHGKTSLIYHGSESFFSGIPSPFSAARYHSLIVDEVPSSLRIIAKTSDGLVMALEHDSLRVCGVQFHPESYLSEYGTEIISKFLKYSKV